MAGTLKVYYLLQTAYWLQQFLLLVLGIEKPRRDFYELVAHHIVTLWMVIWSYIMNMTLTGNIIFLTMDWSDVFLAVCIFSTFDSQGILNVLLAAVQMLQLPRVGADQDHCVCMVHMLLDVSTIPHRW
jgi:TLC domain